MGSTDGRLTNTVLIVAILLRSGTQQFGTCPAVHCALEGLEPVDWPSAFPLRRLSKTGFFTGDERTRPSISTALGRCATGSLFSRRPVPHLDR